MCAYAARAFAWFRSASAADSSGVGSPGRHPGSGHGIAGFFGSRLAFTNAVKSSASRSRVSAAA